MLGAKLEIRYRSPSELRGYSGNARTHSDAQLAQIAKSIEQFGFTNPILVAEDGEVIAGHGRLEAARRAGLDAIPTIELAGLTVEQRHALVLADNRIAENSGWDGALLALELEALQGVGFDLGVLGFSDRELGEFLQPKTRPGQTDKDDVPQVEAVAISRPGDLWRCGDHVVCCGDVRDSSAVAALMAGARADVVWTDPPYNVAYAGGRAILNDDQSAAEYLAFMASALRACSSVLEPGGGCYVAHADTERVTVTTAFLDAGFHLGAVVIWRKDALVLGRSDYQWIHEPILYGWKPGKTHRWYGGRKQTTVMEFGDDSPFRERADGRLEIALGDRLLVVEGGATIEEFAPSMLREARPRKADLHPTMKPVALIERMLRNSARPGAIVFDPFGGSGSTLIAAERLGMAARMLDLEPLYVDVMVRRWQDYSGKRAFRIGDAVEFNHAGTKADAGRVETHPG